MYQALGLIPAQGTALSKIQRVYGIETGLSVLDDFLPWQGLPKGGLTLLEGAQAPHLARKLSGRLQIPDRALWVHSLKLRPFFHESTTCFRLQAPDEAGILQLLPEVLSDPSFSCLVVQLCHPLTRVKAAELLRQVKASSAAVVVIAKQEKTIPDEFCDLILDCQEDFLAVRRAQNRPVPFWIPYEMVDLNSGASDLSVLNQWNARDTIYG